MARDEEPWVQLATRIPKPLHHAVRLHCVRNDTTLMDFIVAAIETKLRQGGRRARRESAKS
jgi:hypothetical protein